MAAPEHREFPPGYRIAERYRLERLLGQGGMGAVYAAFDEELTRQVAVKLLLSTYAGSREVVERFEREARAAATIQHPGVVEIYDRGNHGGLLYLVMERLRGQSLDARIHAAGQLTPAFVARVGVDLCAALQAAHQKGIVHRDLKPSNIFLAEVGEFCDVVKVLDFGVAKLREGPQLTGSNQVFGTLAYMPPEQIQSAKAVVPASDLYAIGCVLFEMVTGHRPFEAVGNAALALAILEDEPRRVPEFRADVPPALIAVIERALRKKPERRFTSALEMGEALYAIAEDFGELAPKRRRPQSSAPPRPTTSQGPPSAPTAPNGRAGAPPKIAASSMYAIQARALEATTPPPRTSLAFPAEAPAVPCGPATNAWNVAEVERQAMAPDSHVRRRAPGTRRLVLAGAAIVLALVLAMALWRGG